MPIGIAPKLPLSWSTEDGHYHLTKTFAENTQQNFKNLVLTSPGEKVMDPEFGVGIRRYLFEQREDIIPDLTSRIYEQAAIYMPYIDIIDIVMTPRANSIGIGEEHTLFVNIEYINLPISLRTNLTIDIG
mgnify:CR=1 FL=1|tara:strand:+ start:509 stop:898 length:390 start_codon:yes stop_codon:yes gene_type:complete